MFNGFRTVIYHADDLESARRWYAQVLGKEPYFSEAYYVGFNVGGFELGLDPGLVGLSRGNRPVAYWRVADAGAAHARLLQLGAKEHRPVQEVGGGVRVASVEDPFGNVVGIIENPHFKLEP